jgi:signal transduction histidine kinase
VGLGASLLFALVLSLAFLVSRSIAQPLQRLTRAATAVANLANAELVRVTDVEQVDEQPPRLAAIDVASGDEVGELAVAFNQVQVTAAQLLERQALTRRNVSLMFANVAQRTQNLVQRQLALVDDLERDEQNTRLLTRLYRLDHLSTRLRRNAENLLVVAGSQNEIRMSAPTPLTTVLRSALAEIEDYQRVRFGAVHDVTVVGPLVSDVVLVFAELLENATSFSPPQSTVDVHAKPVAGGWCQISVVDHGIGMTPEWLAEENRRLVERERLDIVPTSVLGLFVVGRLARRHGLAVQLLATPGGGTTATVAIPPALYTIGTASIPLAQPARTPRRPAISAPLVTVPALPTVPGGFSWFFTRTNGLADAGQVVATESEAGPVPAVAEVRPTNEVRVANEVRAASGVPANSGIQADSGIQANSGIPVASGDGATHGGLQRRVPGAQLPAAALRTPEPAPAARPVHDPSAARSTMDAFQTAVARAGNSTSASPAPTGNGGPASLSRRTPGASLAPGLREAPPGTPSRRTRAAPARDPEAARAAFDAYAAGLAEADKQAGSRTGQS